MNDFLTTSLMEDNEKPLFDMPTVSKSLLDALEQHFPAQDFTPVKPYRELDFHYGQRSVINFLKHHYRMQNENILTPEK